MMGKVSQIFIYFRVFTIGGLENSFTLICIYVILEYKAYILYIIEIAIISHWLEIAYFYYWINILFEYIFKSYIDILMLGLKGVVIFFERPLGMNINIIVVFAFINSLHE